MVSRSTTFGGPPRGASWFQATSHCPAGAWYSHWHPCAIIASSNLLLVIFSLLIFCHNNSETVKFHHLIGFNWTLLPFAKKGVRQKHNEELTVCVHSGQHWTTPRALGICPFKRRAFRYSATLTYTRIKLINCASLKVTSWTNEIPIIIFNYWSYNSCIPDIC